MLLPYEAREREPAKLRRPVEPHLPEPNAALRLEAASADRDLILGLAALLELRLGHPPGRVAWPSLAFVGGDMSLREAAGDPDLMRIPWPDPMAEARIIPEGFGLLDPERLRAPMDPRERAADVARDRLRDLVRIPGAKDCVFFRRPFRPTRIAVEFAAARRRRVEMRRLLELELVRLVVDRRQRPAEISGDRRGLLVRIAPDELADLGRRPIARAWRPRHKSSSAIRVPPSFS